MIVLDRYTTLGDDLATFEIFQLWYEENQDIVQQIEAQTQANIKAHIEEYEQLFPGWPDHCRKQYLKERLEEISKYILHWQNVHVENFHEGNTVTVRFAMDRVKTLKELREKLLNELNSLVNKHLYQDKNGSYTKGGDITEEMIQRARDYPFQDLLESYGWKRRGNMFVCQIHGDKDPSFHVRRRDNRAHCFGCGWRNDKYADTIDFVMDWEGIEWKEAVKKLQ